MNLNILFQNLDTTKDKERKKMKYMVLAMFLLFGTHAFAEEVEGKDAKNIVLTGEVMGAQLIGEKYLKMLDVQAGTFFSVRSDGKIYNCFFTFPGGYFCESLD
jgi:hypothetical protein